MTHYCKHVFAGLIFFILISPFNSAHAEPHGPTAKRLTEAPVINPLLGFPGQEDGQWQVKVQLIWDKVAHKLSRKRYEVWNPVPSRNLEFIWTPEDNTPNKATRITGKGKLLWRTPGAPSYDKSAVVVVYRGQMHDGRAQGQGEYLDVSGHSYRGEWKAGLMHGKGRFKRPNGDEFSGELQHGLPHGEGQFVDATGTVYEGLFIRGKRHGQGSLFSPDGEIYTAQWLNGFEVPKTQTLIRKVQNAGPANPDGLSLAITVNELTEEKTYAQGAIDYTAFSKGNTLIIQPKYKRVMGVWKGDTNIFAQQKDYSRHGNFNDSFLQTSNQQFPVSITLDLNNYTRSSVSITGAFIEVLKSERDLEPAIEVTRHVSNLIFTCSTPANSQDYLGTIKNFGWSNANQAQLDMTLSHPVKGQSVKLPVIPLGDIVTTRDYDLTRSLLWLGYDARRWAKQGFQCSTSNTLQCLENLKTTGVFGHLRDLITVKDKVIFTKAAGFLSYRWTDHRGNTRVKKSTLAYTLNLGLLNYISECGEGGDAQEVADTPFLLPLDRYNYRLPVHLGGNIPAGTAGRWSLHIGSQQSSNHKLSFGFILSDGRTVYSRPVELTYFRSRPGITTQ